MELPAVLASLRVGFDALRANRLRTALSTLGVVIGVAALVAVLSLGDGMERYAREQVDRGTDVLNVFVSPVTADTLDGLAIPRERFHVFGAADAAAAAREVRGAAGASVSVAGRTLLTAPHGGRRRGAEVAGMLAGDAEFHQVELLAGRWFTAAEARRDVPVVVVSHWTAREMMRGGSAEALVGRTVRLLGAPAEVVGVLAPEPGEERERRLSAIVPLRAADRVMVGGAPRARTLLVKAPAVERVEAVRAATEDWLAARHGPWEDDFGVRTKLRYLQQMERGFLLFKLFMGAIAGISLLVGGIGIMNVLLASVTERTREIGIRKATGARAADIRAQFLAESVAISGTGSLLGLLLGVGGAFGVAAVLRHVSEAQLHAGLSPSTLAVAAGSAVGVGLVFGTWPARRAARLSPIDAIRHE